MQEIVLKMLFKFKFCHLGIFFIQCALVGLHLIGNPDETENWQL